MEVFAVIEHCDGEPAPIGLELLNLANSIKGSDKSNAIVLVKGETTVGIGAGQMSRVDSCLIAARKAGKRAKGSVLASDAMFPARDGLDAAATPEQQPLFNPVVPRETKKSLPPPMSMAW